MKIVDVQATRIALPLREPIRTARTTLTEREVLIVRLKAEDGTLGFGEVSSFATDWYLPETLGEDEALMSALFEAVRGRDFDEPREADAALREVGGAQDLPAARAGVECAIWDIAARQAGLSLARYLGFTHDRAAGGVVLPLADTDERLAQVSAAVGEGYGRIKMKIARPSDIEALQAVRNTFPDIDLIADVNGALSERGFLDIASEIDALNLVCIEEPIVREETESLQDFYERIRAVQVQINTPICLDESWTSEQELRTALDVGAARCYAVKICKLGGISATLDILDEAHQRGIAVWMGGMFDTGISKAVHAALSLHPANIVAGDISDTSRYFTRDICTPAFTLDDGYLDLSRLGLGFTMCQ